VINGKIVLDMPNDEYHASLGISKSGLDLIERSPAHYKNKKFNSKGTRAMMVGTAIHAAILEPERFEKEYIFSESRDRVDKKYKELKKIHGEDLVLTGPEGRNVIGMKDAVYQNEKAATELNKEGMAEASFFTTDPETGIQLRCRFDWVNCDRIGVDVKKTQDLRKFNRSVSDYRYHVQDAMYSFVYEQVTGDALEKFYFLAVEEQAPYANKMFLCDDFYKEIGAYYFRKNLRMYADCVDKNVWPESALDHFLEPSFYDVNNYENDMEVIV